MDTKKKLQTLLCAAGALSLTGCNLQPLLNLAQEVYPPSPQDDIVTTTEAPYEEETAFFQEEFCTELNMNICVYGPPPQDDPVPEPETLSEPETLFEPETNIGVEVYGPPEWFENTVEPETEESLDE